MVSYRGDRQSLSAMRHRIRIEKRIVTTDTDSGQPRETWEFFTEVSAGKRSKRGFESVPNASLEVIGEVIFRIRYNKDINEQMRIIFQGMAYNLTFVEDVNDGGRFLDLYTKVVK